MRKLPRLWYCDHHEIPLPPGHKFPTAKYRLLREQLAHEAEFSFEPAPFADPESLMLAHDPSYVYAFLHGTLAPNVLRRIGFPWSENLVRRTLASVGGTIEAARDALALGWGGNLAGGTHHAFRDEGAGFCVFNDIAVAIRALKVARPAIVDLDVHQGDGTAAIFTADPDVLTLSIHGTNNFPFRKRISRIDVALPDNADDDEFLSCLTQVLPRVREFHPGIIFYQSGVDGLYCDTLGRLALTHEGLEERDRLVFRLCAETETPCVVTLGGGYADPIAETVRAHANTFGQAARILTRSKSDC
jgi:acetoin utilization deacetylase AcuC-like enzyme